MSRFPKIMYAPIQCILSSSRPWWSFLLYPYKVRFLRAIAWLPGYACISGPQAGKAVDGCPSVVISQRKPSRLDKSMFTRIPQICLARSEVSLFYFAEFDYLIYLDNSTLSCLKKILMSRVHRDMRSFAGRSKLSRSNPIANFSNIEEILCL